MWDVIFFSLIATASFFLGWGQIKRIEALRAKKKLKSQPCKQQHDFGACSIGEVAHTEVDTTAHACSLAGR